MMELALKDIEMLWKRYQEDGCKRGISVAQFFESYSSGLPRKSGIDFRLREIKLR